MLLDLAVCDSFLVDPPILRELYGITSYVIFDGNNCGFQILCRDDAECLFRSRGREEPTFDKALIIVYLSSGVFLG